MGLLDFGSEKKVIVGGVSIDRVSHVEISDTTKDNTIQPMRVIINGRLIDDTNSFDYSILKLNPLTKEEKMKSLKANHNSFVSVKHPALNKINFFAAKMENAKYDVYQHWIQVKVDLLEQDTTEEKQQEKDGTKPKLKTSNVAGATVSAAALAGSQNSDEKSLITELLDKLEGLLEKVTE
jgi:hypothetical protein